MPDRGGHYETAFEAFLRERKTPYVAVDEAKRALFANAKLKSFDFVVYSKDGPNLLVDVKGRARRRGAQGGFQTWTTQQDVSDLLEWEAIFGDGFKAMLGFVFWIDAPLVPDETMFCHHDRWYLMMGISLTEYREHMRRRSVRWDTVSIPAEQFRTLARPLGQWL